MHRYELTDTQWDQLAVFFPDCDHSGGPGAPWQDHRRMVNGILWHLHTGAPWPDLPERYGPWKTVYDRFQRWRRDGTWAKILDALLLRLDKAGLIDRDLWLVDGSVIRASRAAAGAKKKIRISRPYWAVLNRCKWLSHKTMHWADPQGALAPRSIWSVTARASCWRSGSPPANGMSPRPLRSFCCGRDVRGVRADGAGREPSRGTKATVTQAFGSGSDAATSAA